MWIILQRDAAGAALLQLACQKAGVVEIAKPAIAIDEHWKICRVHHALDNINFSPAFVCSVVPLQSELRVCVLDTSSSSVVRGSADFAVGLLQMAGGLGLSLLGLQYLDVGTSALIFYTMPLWLVAIEWTIDRQRQSLLDVIALTCGMLGLGLLASGANPVATSHGILGIALLSTAAFSWALGTWIHKRTPEDGNAAPSFNWRPQARL